MATTAHGREMVRRQQEDRIGRLWRLCTLADVESKLTGFRGGAACAERREMAVRAWRDEIRMLNALLGARAA